MDSKKRISFCLYIYLEESNDGKARGEILNAPESKFGKDYYFSHQYSWGNKSILLGRGTFQKFLGWIKADKIDYTGWLLKI